MKTIGILISLFLLAAGSALAATVAFDSAADSAYSDGWQSGDNGGTGWGGSWSLNTTFPPDGNKAGHLVATSQNNGFSDGNIDTSGRAWGLYANSGYSATATRPFSGTLGIGQSVLLDMDNGFIDNNATFGFTLTAFGDPMATEQFSFYFLGGSNTYFTSTGQMMFQTTTDTGVGFTSAGLHVAFTLTAAQAYSVAITPNGGATTILNGTFLTAATNFDHIELYNNFAGPTSTNNGFFNRVQVIPEPGTLGLLGLGLAGLLGLRRRR